MITTTEGIKFQQYANSLNVTRDDAIIAQLVVKNYELSNGNTGVCLYSVVDDKEYFIRKDKPTIELIEQNGKNIVLIDCHPNNAKFNLAFECSSLDEANLYVANFTKIVDRLWKYRNQQIAKIMSSKNKESKAAKKQNKEVKKDARKPAPQNTLGNIGELLGIPKELDRAIRTIVKLYKSKRLVNGEFNEVFTVYGQNAISSLCTSYEKVKGTVKADPPSPEQKEEVPAEFPTAVSSGSVENVQTSSNIEESTTESPVSGEVPPENPTSEAEVPVNTQE